MYLHLPQAFVPQQKYQKFVQSTFSPFQTILTTFRGGFNNNKKHPRGWGVVPQFVPLHFSSIFTPFLFPSGRKVREAERKKEREITVLIEATTLAMEPVCMQHRKYVVYYKFYIYGSEKCLTRL